MFDTMQVAKSIREARIRKNLTQMALADEMGVSYQAVSNWERGNSMPDISKLEQLCNVLGLTLNELLGARESTVSAVRKVMQQEELSPEELAEVAPVVPPQEFKQAAERSKKKEIDCSAILSMAPFLDAEFLDELVENARVEDLSELVALAPFLSRETLDKLVREAEGDSLDGLEELVALAPFLSKETLDVLAQKVAAEDMSELVALAPFLSRKTLDKLAREAEGDSLEELVPLAPFLSKETLDALATRILVEGDAEDATGLYPFLSKETMRKLAKVLLEDGNFEAMQHAAPYL